MVRWIRATTLGVLALTVQACGRAPEKEARGAVQELLAAAQTRDRAAFEAHVDRPAVRADLRQQLLDLARPNALEVEGGPSDFALDRMINPDAIQVVDAATEAPLATPPSKDQIGALLKPLGRRRVCLHDAADDQRCLLTFAREDGKWRLVGMPADGRLSIRVAGEG